ncbi:MAG: hypothetical protein ACRDYA_05560 [Egibacteraceae bacterium]
MRAFARATRLELVRLIGWRRWAVAAAVLTVVGWVLAEELNGSARDRGFRVNLWDVPLEALNNVVIVAIIVVPLFVGLVGDVLLGDRRTNFAALSLHRIRSRSRWWAAKLTAVSSAAFLYFGLIVAVMSAVGAVALPTGTALSDYGAATPDPFASAASALKSYGPPPFPTLALVGIGAEAAYAAAATAALTMVVLTITLLWPRPWTPVVTILAISLVFLRVDPTNVLHPLIHLFWDYHGLAARSVAVTWSASAIYLSVEVWLALMVGCAILRRCDL